MNLGMAG